VRGAVDGSGEPGGERLEALCRGEIRLDAAVDDDLELAHGLLVLGHQDVHERVHLVVEPIGVDHPVPEAEPDRPDRRVERSEKVHLFVIRRPI
jgi:hypothetical protein